MEKRIIKAKCLKFYRNLRSADGAIMDLRLMKIWVIMCTLELIHLKGNAKPQSFKFIPKFSLSFHEFFWWCMSLSPFSPLFLTVFCFWGFGCSSWKSTLHRKKSLVTCNSDFNV